MQETGVWQQVLTILAFFPKLIALLFNLKCLKLGLCLHDNATVMLVVILLKVFQPVFTFLLQVRLQLDKDRDPLIFVLYLLGYK